ncbi:MAG: CbiM family transporter [Negativicutes bacterium]|nr:CbiM family transporter [Negativicutes bacterium]
MRSRKGANTVHLSDGILNIQTVAVTSAAAGGMLIYALKGMKEDEIPKVSLATAAFFTAALISIPIGPSSVHPFLGGMIGILLGRRSAVAVFTGLLLQALFFQSGGLTTLGLNTVIMTLPALISSCLLRKLLLRKLVRTDKHLALISGLLGALSVILGVSTFALVLYLSNSIYSEGVLSAIHLLLLAHIPVIIFEGFMTTAVIGFIKKTRPGFLPLTYGTEQETL